MTWIIIIPSSFAKEKCKKVDYIFQQQRQLLLLYKIFFFSGFLPKVYCNLPKVYCSLTRFTASIYSMFHKTLPKSSLQMHWILVRFYEMSNIIIFILFKNTLYKYFQILQIIFIHFSLVFRCRPALIILWFEDLFKTFILTEEMFMHNEYGLGQGWCDVDNSVCFCIFHWPVQLSVKNCYKSVVTGWRRIMHSRSMRKVSF